MAEGTRVERPVPSCPVCLERNATPERGMWCCCTCWTLYTGSQDEYARFHRPREAWKVMLVDAAERRAELAKRGVFKGSGIVLPEGL